MTTLRQLRYLVALSEELHFRRAAERVHVTQPTLSAQIQEDALSFIEVIIPDVLNAYDVVVWAEEGNHAVLTQRKDEAGTTRMLIRP